jgi:hypothetical protein
VRSRRRKPPDPPCSIPCSFDASAVGGMTL